jgi:hypothetical protein
MLWYLRLDLVLFVLPVIVAGDYLVSGAREPGAAAQKGTKLELYKAKDFQAAWNSGKWNAAEKKQQIKKFSDGLIGWHGDVKLRPRKGSPKSAAAQSELVAAEAPALASSLSGTHLRLIMMFASYFELFLDKQSFDSHLRKCTPLQVCAMVPSTELARCCCLFTNKLFCH